MGRHFAVIIFLYCAWLDVIETCTEEVDIVVGKAITSRIICSDSLADGSQLARANETNEVEIVAYSIVFGSLDKSGKCREHEIECYRLPQRTNFRFSVCFLNRLWRLRAADFCVLKTRHEVMSSGTSAFPCSTLSPVMFVLRFPIAFSFSVSLSWE